jgi:hypothetical protein
MISAYRAKRNRYFHSSEGKGKKKEHTYKKHIRKIVNSKQTKEECWYLTLRLLMSYISAGERPQAARLLRSWVRIPPGAWIFVCCECRVLSGRVLCDKLITRPEESYRLCCVVVYDLETSRIGAPYIYDISNLRINDLTLILLTWRKW